MDERERIGARDDIAAATLAGMTWAEVARDHRRIAFWVLATGSVEQHGPHLPLGADLMVASRIVREITDRFPAVRLPFMDLGVNFAFQGWPGNLGVSADTFMRTLVDIGSQAARWCRRLLIVNGHDENQAPLILAARQLVQDHGMEVVSFEWADLVRDTLRTVCESKTEMHAGEGLTSLFLHWFPEHVRRDEIADGAQAPGGLTADDIHVDARAIRPHLLDPTPQASSGVFGRPTLASADKGRLIAEALATRVGQLVRERNWETPHGN
jgi:creatinine amidohydrolase